MMLSIRSLNNFVGFIWLFYACSLLVTAHSSVRQCVVIDVESANVQGKPFNSNFLIERCCFVQCSPAPTSSHSAPRKSLFTLSNFKKTSYTHVHTSSAHIIYHWKLDTVLLSLPQTFFVFQLSHIFRTLINVSYQIAHRLSEEEALFMSEPKKFLHKIQFNLRKECWAAKVTLLLLCDGKKVAALSFCV